MQLAIKCLVGLAVLAAPCAYDVTSREPSVLAGIIAAASPAVKNPSEIPASGAVIPTVQTAQRPVAQIGPAHGQVRE